MPVRERRKVCVAILPQRGKAYQPRATPWEVSASGSKRSEGTRHGTDLWGQNDGMRRSFRTPFLTILLPRATRAFSALALGWYAVAPLGLECGRRVGARMRSPRWGANAVAALGRECGRPVGLQNIQGTVLFGIADYVWYQRLFGAMGLRYGLVAGGWSCAVNGEGNRWWRLVEHRWCWVGFGYDSRRSFVHLAELFGSRGDLSLLGFLHLS